MYQEKAHAILINHTATAHSVLFTQSAKHGGKSADNKTAVILSLFHPRLA